jgi:hypothetical protein
MWGEQNGATLVPLTMSSAVVEFDQYSAGWQLAQPPEEDTNEPRVFTTHITFDEPFANVPMVHIGIAGFDIDNCDTARLSARAGPISPTGFDLTVLTWRTTRVYKAEISWIALGQQACQ